MELDIKGFFLRKSEYQLAKDYVQVKVSDFAHEFKVKYLDRKEKIAKVL